jgi:5-deoxy-glucuronate isomerase
MNMRTLLAAGRETAHIDLALADLAEGEVLDLEASPTHPSHPSHPERAAVILSGRVDATAGETALGVAGGRSSVFEGPGDTVYTPAGTALRLQAVEGPAQVALIAAGAPADGDPPVDPSASGAPADGGPEVAPSASPQVAPSAADGGPPARIIRPGDQRIAEVGKGNWSRTVRTILGPEHQARRLLLGETINPPGNWSSYPPHRHDRHDPPREVNLEEVYMFRVDPPGGFGIQILYDENGHEQSFLVRDDDVAAIRSGFHPVVAAAGYSLYYLWAMAGEGREMIPYMDPAHVWVQEES